MPEAHIAPLGSAKGIHVQEVWLKPLTLACSVHLACVLAKCAHRIQVLRRQLFRSPTKRCGSRSLQETYQSRRELRDTHIDGPI